MRPCAFQGGRPRHHGTAAFRPGRGLGVGPEGPVTFYFSSQPKHMFLVLSTRLGKEGRTVLPEENGNPEASPDPFCMPASYTRPERSRMLRLLDLKPARPGFASLALC